MKIDQTFENWVVPGTEPQRQIVRREVHHRVLEEFQPGVTYATFAQEVEAMFHGLHERTAQLQKAQNGCRLSEPVLTELHHLANCKPYGGQQDWLPRINGKEWNRDLLRHYGQLCPYCFATRVEQRVTQLLNWKKPVLVGSAIVMSREGDLADHADEFSQAASDASKMARLRAKEPMLIRRFYATPGGRGAITWHLSFVAATEADDADGEPIALVSPQRRDVVVRQWTDPMSRRVIEQFASVYLCFWTGLLKPQMVAHLPAYLELVRGKPVK